MALNAQQQRQVLTAAWQAYRQANPTVSLPADFAAERPTFDAFRSWLRTAANRTAVNTAVDAAGNADITTFLDAVTAETPNAAQQTLAAQGFTAFSTVMRSHLRDPRHRLEPGFSTLVDALASRYDLTGNQRTRLAHVVDSYVDASRHVNEDSGVSINRASQALVTSSLVHLQAGDADNTRTLSHFEMYMGQPYGGIREILCDGPGRVFDIERREAGDREGGATFAVTHRYVPNGDILAVNARDFFSRGVRTDRHGADRTTDLAGLAARRSGYADTGRRRPQTRANIAVPLPPIEAGDNREERARDLYDRALRDNTGVGEAEVARAEFARLAPLRDAYYRRILDRAVASGLRVSDADGGNVREPNAIERLRLLRDMATADMVIRSQRIFATDVTRFDVEVIGRYTGGIEALRTEMARIQELPEGQRAAAYTAIIDQALGPPAPMRMGSLGHDGTAEPARDIASLQRALELGTTSQVGGDVRSMALSALLRTNVTSIT